MQNLWPYGRWQVCDVTFSEGRFAPPFPGLRALVRGVKTACPLRGQISPGLKSLSATRLGKIAGGAVVDLINAIGPYNAEGNSESNGSIFEESRSPGATADPQEDEPATRGRARLGYPTRPSSIRSSPGCCRPRLCSCSRRPARASRGRSWGNTCTRCRSRTCRNHWIASTGVMPG